MKFCPDGEVKLEIKLGSERRVRVAVRLQVMFKLQDLREISDQVL